MDDLYREEVMDHYKNPRNFGVLDGASVVVEEKNVGCGDEIQISVRCKTKNGKQQIEEIVFQGQGCAVSMAFTSLLIERVKDEGWNIDELKNKSEEDLVKLVGGGGVSPARQKCLRVGIKALKKAVKRL